LLQAGATQHRVSRAITIATGRGFPHIKLTARSRTWALGRSTKCCRESRMADSFAPQPEEEGRLGPPRRWPPTAVGTSTPPPPRPRPRRRRRPSAVFRPWYIVVATSLVGGSVLLLLNTWLLVRVMGATVASISVLTALMYIWVRSGAASRWLLWHRNGWIQKRQRDLGQSSRPSA
jgi:hypothetical protein